MTREEAARLLGVPADADPRAVRRAFRLWVSVAHPDRGGAAESLDRLRNARAILLADLPVTGSAPESDVSDAAYCRPAARIPWRAVVRRPSPRERVLEAAAIAAAVVAAVVPASPAVQAVAAALLGAVAAWVIARLRLEPSADSGHRVLVATFAWLAVVGVQLVASALVGQPLLPVLPVLAVPLVATVSLVLMPRGGLALRR